MPRVASEKQYNTFVKGLVTEASPLTFPEQSFLEGDNIVLFKDGSVRRRLGLTYEAGFIKTAAGFNTEGVKKSFHIWEFAGGTHILGVVQIGERFWFMDMEEEAPSSHLKISGGYITIAGAGQGIEVASINNLLVVVGKGLANPVALQYNSTTDIITINTITVEVRDFWGVDDGLAVDRRPKTLSASHKYNLRNQGWIPTVVSSCGTDAIDCTFEEIGVYPSNADTWRIGIETDPTNPQFGRYRPFVMRRNSQDFMHAPKGRYVINALSRGASRVARSGVTGLPADKEAGRFATVSSYAGRIFYSGIVSQVTGEDKKTPNYGGTVFFTQTTQNISDLGKCYQEADPTGEISDLVDTDGGTINIPAASKIVKILPLNKSLIIFAENGVWEVFGGDIGFKATEYQLAQVTNIGVRDKDTIVVTGDAVLYWADSGIFVLAPEQVSGRLQAQNISLGVIQTYFSSINPSSVKGIYEEEENRVRWLYNGSSYKELILDLALQAFFISTAKDTIELADYVKFPTQSRSSKMEDVYVGFDRVLAGADAVQVETRVDSRRLPSFGFLSVDNNQFTIAKYSSNTFLDWGTENYSSYMITGYELLQDFMRKKQAAYLVTLFERTESGFVLSGGSLTPLTPSSCLVQAQWGWANSAKGGKWGTQFQAYRQVRPYNPSGVGDDYDTGEQVVVTRNKLRGSGRALSLYFQSEQGKDFHLLGWGLPATIGTTV